MEAYKQQLKTKRPQIGALVMNCNPFTLGHQYLVEYAAARVDKLYIFVVEEDKSQFPFADRIELVKQGVKHLSNVEVLPSGKFIISQTTFSGYFNKAELQDVQVDSSEDVEIFGREIAPTLGITIRFAGEEPTDNVTRQYNETMKEILPRYGVEFCEIPRKEFDGEPISASKVRVALKVGDFDKIKKLVPYSTLRYLRGQAFLKGNDALFDYELMNPFA
ncbi:MAG: adenylyltransferase/cytidyltransferase family protein [Selenomonadaceae bacterium]|nr:adenylyltransferase/cytidyltransferase family protein [Selenomonadaceae bacterium]